jgi:hypothetical protein
MALATALRFSSAVVCKIMTIVPGEHSTKRQLLVGFLILITLCVIGGVVLQGCRFSDLDLHVSEGALVDQAGVVPKPLPTPVLPKP